jgi:hypothetical protein
MEMASHDLAVHTHAVSLEEHTGSRLELLARMHERIPDGIPTVAQKQALHGPAGRYPMPQQARREHARVVDDEQVAGSKVLDEVREVRVGRLAGVAVQYEQT